MSERSGKVRDGATRMRRPSFSVAWAVGGFISFALGALGAVLPIVPTTPFLLVAAFCFARSSDRLNTWFHSTKLYHNVLEDYVSKRTMTVKAKLTLLVPLTIVLALSFFFMGSVPVGRIVVAIVWVAHVVYFGFVVKTDRGASVAADSATVPSTGDGTAASESSLPRCSAVVSAEGDARMGHGPSGHPSSTGVDRERA